MQGQIVRTTHGEWITQPPRPCPNVMWPRIAGVSDCQLGRSEASADNLSVSMSVVGRSVPHRVGRLLLSPGAGGGVLTAADSVVTGGVLVRICAHAAAQR